MKDSIEMRRVVDPDAALAAFVEPSFKVSPDNQVVALLLSRGNLATGLTEYSVSTLRLAEISQYVQGRAPSRPALRQEVAFRTSANSPAIEQLQWIDRHQLAFIGRDNERASQVYGYDVVTGSLTRLTEHGDDVVRYALSPDRRTLVYAAKSYPDWSARNSRGYVLESQPLHSLAWIAPNDYVATVRYFVRDLDAQKTSPIDAPPSQYSHSIQVSNSGRYASFVAFDVSGIPAEWSEYSTVRQRARLGKDPTILANDAFGSPSNWFGRLVLVDAKTGGARTGIDAPALPDEGFLPVWAPDENHLILLNALMPLTAALDADERKRRQSKAAVIELQMRTGVVSRVLDVPLGSTATSVDWISPDKIVIHFAGSAGGRRARTFVRRGLAWSEARARAPGAARDHHRVQLVVKQDMNTSVEIAARDVTTGRELVLTELNPQLVQLDLGTVQEFTWSDRAGRVYEGGLILPPSYDRARQYPVVIQTYGFDRNTFVVDGPFGITSAYAARPLASSGILVLQLPLKASASGQSESRTSPPAECVNWEECGENPLFLEKVDSAIDALMERHLSDGRIGLIGFSREGMHAFYAATFTRHKLAAVTVADSIGSSPLAYALFYGFPPPGMLEFEDNTVMGASFWGKDGIDKWTRRSPIFHLDRISAPIRFETYGPIVGGYVDAFALLKRQLRPTEMIQIPSASHRLQAPFARYTSQQGNVDWFRFWLKGDEDPDPGKLEQYSRWRRLREQLSQFSK